MLHRRAFLPALLGVSLAAPALAEPRSRTRHVTATGPRGTSTGTSTRNWDRITGATSRSAVQTGPGGQSRTVAGQGTVQNGTYTGTRTVTGPGGNSRTQDITVSRP
ncbi:MAG: hypothetical protein V4653_05175 [Pseudomonadota bacterium]